MEFTITTSGSATGQCAYFKGFAIRGTSARINIIDNYNICANNPATFVIDNNLTTSVSVPLLGLTLSINTTTTPHSLDVVSTSVNLNIEHRILR